ncbi:hypothetical protein BY458DRAFT_511323 [Sporodiniella umbellata]|nr:hypothetical protein BY458DRAFT_511323 [Sporodiniella umbellata]
METITTYSNSTKPILPDSPEDIESFAMHSDDLQPTSDLHSSLLQGGPRSRLVVVGQYDKKVILGRGGASTIKIGRRNRQISRTHVSIEFNPDLGHFQLTILGLNGANVDQVLYNQHAIVVLEDHSSIDVLGDHVEFRVPPRPLDTKQHILEPAKDAASPKEDNKEISKVQEAVKEEAVVIEEKPKVTPEIEEKESIQPSNDSDNKLQEESDKPLIKDTTETTLHMHTAESVEDNKESIRQLQEEKEIESMKIAEESWPIDTLKNDDDDKLSEMEEQDYSEVIIDALVFSRTSSMPVSDICSRIMKSNPSYAEQPRELWTERIREVLKEKPFFGEIQRKGKTADGSPKENLYYYNSELDPVEWRRATYTQVGRSARKCTLKDKQYFWKIPPKLGRHRSSYVPPPASFSESKKRSKEEQSENSDPKKTKL